MDSTVWCFTELLLGTHLPRNLSLAPALDLTKHASLFARDPARRARFRDQPQVGDGGGVAWVAQRWGLVDSDEGY